jgi:hypothetical protein
MLCQEVVKRKMKKESTMKEDAPANSVGGGNIAGLGVGPQGEPGRPPEMMPMLRRGKFAGKDTFLLPRKKFLDFQNLSKQDRKWWKKYVNDPAAQEISEYANRNPKKAIVFECEDTGSMFYARYPKE